MQLPDFRAIAGSAAFLDERADRGLTGDGDPDTLADETVETIDRLVDAGEVRWGGERLDRRRLLAHATAGTWPADEPLPGWIGSFERLYEALVAGDGPPEWVDEEIPFVHLLFDATRPAAVARTGVLGDDCVRAFREGLVRRFAEIAARALHVDFLSFVAERDPDALDERSTESSAWYDRYVTAFRTERAPAFFERYPMVARLFATASDQWEASVCRFQSRVRADRDALGRRLGTESLGRVVAVDPLGDPHAGYERVSTVTFASGDRVVYKPRSVDGERATYEFQSALAREFADVPESTTPWVLARDDYGWVAVVDQTTHDTRASLDRYYRRAGALLFVAATLGLTDCHRSNVLADDTPVIVDAETVFEAGTRPATSDESGLHQTLRQRLLGEGILATGLLPTDRLPAGRSGYAAGRAESVTDSFRWENVNTDGMDAAYVTVESEAKPNVPRYRGRRVPPDQWCDELVAGFTATHEAVTAERARVRSLLRESFAGVETRTLLRATRAYAGVLDALESPKALRDGARYDLAIRRRLSVRVDEPVYQRETKLLELDHGRWDELIAAEQAALRRRDVPRFTSVADDRGLWFDGERVVTALTERTGVDRAVERIAALDPDDRRRQIDRIRACFATGDANRFHPDGRI